MYGQDTPPEYDLSKIEVPMALFSGDVDELGDKIDIAWLLDESQSGLKASKVVHHEQLHFAHDSFTMANNMTYIASSVIPLAK